MRRTTLFTCFSLGTGYRNAGVLGEFWGSMGDRTPETVAPIPVEGFTGNFPLRMDSTQRVAIPARFKEVLEKEYGMTASHVVLVPDSGKVKVLPVPVWKRMQQQLDELSDFDPNADDYRTFVFGNMAVCQLDAQNRIRLTPSLCELAGLDKEVVVVGRRNMMEIWDAAKFKEFNDVTSKNFKTVRLEVFRNCQTTGK